MNIKGKKVILRAITREDLPMIVRMFNDPEMEDAVVGWSFPLSLEQQEKWFEKNMDDQKNLRFVIETIDDGAVGIATLTNVDWKNKSATNGIKIERRERRAKGIGTDVVMAIERFAFEELGFNRLESTIFETNEASLALYKKCGWIVEGKKRSCVYKKGEWRDLMIVSILKTDYERLISKNCYWQKAND